MNHIDVRKYLSIIYIVARRNAANEASTVEEQAKLKINHLRQELAEKEPQIAKTEKEDASLVNELATKRNELKELEVRLIAFLF